MELQEVSEASAVAFFCDDVRVEANGKTIYIGVYDDIAVVPDKFPLTIPAIYAVFYYHEPVGTLEKLTMTVRASWTDRIIAEGIFFDGGQNRPLLPDPVYPITDARTARFSGALPLGPLVVDKPGRLGMFFRLEDREIYAGAVVFDRKAEPVRQEASGDPV